MKFGYLCVLFAFSLPIVGFSQVNKRAAPFGVEIGAAGSCEMLKNKIKTIDPSVNFKVQIVSPDVSGVDFRPAGKLYPDAPSLYMMCISGKIRVLTINVNRDEFGKNIVDAIETLNSKYTYVSGEDTQEMVKGGYRFYDSAQAAIKIDTTATSNFRKKVFTIEYEDMTDVKSEMLKRKQEDFKNNVNRFNTL